MNQPIQLGAFTQEGRASRAALCPVRMLKQYVLRTASWRVTDQLFGPGKKGAPLSKQRLAHWVADSIVEAYHATGCVLLATVKCHTTRAVATSYAALRGTATWASPCTFTRFYRLNVTPSSLISSAILSEDV